jgi:hypothetical protein
VAVDLECFLLKHLNNTFRIESKDGSGEERKDCFGFPKINHACVYWCVEKSSSWNGAQQLLCVETVLQEE